jgi:hypothetical protein
MDSPEKQETVSERADVSTGDLIAETFDKLDADGSGEMETTTEDLGGDDNFEKESEGIQAEGDSETETTSQEATQEATQELKEEIQDAADSDYNEPAPERWKPEIQEIYNSLPPSARKAMLEGIYKPMQRAYTESTQELKKQREQIMPVIEALNQYRTQFESQGVNPVEAFQTQMAWASHLNRVGAEQGIRDMAEAYGLNKHPSKTGQEEYLTPAERGFKQQLEHLTKQVNEHQLNAQKMTETQKQEQFAAQQAEVRNHLNAFINEKTDDGKPAHPHVEKVASNIAGILRGGLIAKADEYGNPIPVRDQLAKAYSMACNLDPALRTPTPNPRQAKLVDAASKSQVVTKTPAGQVDATEDIPMSSFIEREWERLNAKSA